MTMPQKPRIGIFIIAYNAVNNHIKTIARGTKDSYDKVEENLINDD